MLKKIMMISCIVSMFFGFVVHAESVKIAEASSGSASTSAASSTSKICNKNQWRSGKKCVACPANASCDGVDFDCKKGYYKSGSKCAKGTAPQQALSDVNEAVKITETGKIAEASSGSASTSATSSTTKICNKNQWKSGKKCVACPANASCDGVDFNCKKGYYRSGSKCAKGTAPQQAVSAAGTNTSPAGTNTVVSVADSTTKLCNKNQWKSGKKCVACPANASCDGVDFNCKKGYYRSGSKCAKGTAPQQGVSVADVAVVKCKEKQGSHESIAWIKKKYKNCSDCATKNIEAGKCSKNKKAHKHYYCECDCS